MKITTEKMKIITALMSGPKTHGQLRMVYYGALRCENPSNTSFYNQLQRMMEAELIQKTAIGLYSITDIGRKQYRA